MSKSSGRSAGRAASSRSGKSKSRQESRALDWATRQDKEGQYELEWTVDQSGGLLAFEQKSSGKVVRNLGKVTEISSTESARSGSLQGKQVIYAKVGSKTLALDHAKIQYRRAHSHPELKDTVEDALEYGAVAMGGNTCTYIMAVSYFLGKF